MTLCLRATNTAGEAMHDVAPEVVYQHITVVADRAAAIQEGAAHEWRMTLPAPSGPGTFPVTVHVRYAGREGRARSELLVHLVRTPGAPPSDVRVTLETEPVARLGHAVVTLENAAPRQVAGRLVVALPPDLRTDPESQPAEVAASGRISLPIVVQNVGGPPGRGSPALRPLRVRAGRHRAVVGESTLSVVAPRAGGRPLLVGLGALAVALAILAVASRRASARRPGE